MPKTFIVISAAAATFMAGTASAQYSRVRALDPITAGYRTKTGDFCIRSGWGFATNFTGRMVREGECRTAADWRMRGIIFDTPRLDAPVVVAAR